MGHYPLLESFNPFATHPFTNNSGIPPLPPSPSTYPLSVPASFRSPSYEKKKLPPTSDSFPSLAAPGSVKKITEQQAPSLQIHTPQPRKDYTALRSPSSLKSPPHIFVPFRKDAASPELRLKMKPPTANRNATVTSTTD